VAEFSEYITIEGDRWDTVAWKAYGNASLYPQIMEANPDVVADPVLPSGTRLLVPIAAAPVIDKTVLPPWKR
jgi:phage tail protein X